MQQQQQYIKTNKFTDLKQISEQKLSVQSISGMFSRYQYNICFAYEFQGSIQQEIMERSFKDIIMQNDIFQNDIQKNGKDIASYTWGNIVKDQESLKEDQPNAFIRKNILDIKQEIVYMMNNSIQIGKHFPVTMYLLEGYQQDLFTLVYIQKHYYGDANVAINFFNLILKHYNNLVQNIPADEIISQSQSKWVPSTKWFYNYVKPSGFWRIFVNIIRIMKVKQVDHGLYSLKQNQIKPLLEIYNKRNPAEMGYSAYLNLDFSLIFKKIKNRNSQISKNSIFNSFLLMGLNEHNKEKRFQELGFQQNVINKMEEITQFQSFKSIDKEYDTLVGNFAVIVAQNFKIQGKSFIELAQEIHNSNQNIKKNKLQVTQYMLMSEIVQYEGGIQWLGSMDSKISFQITNWTNFQYLQDPHSFLHNCKPINTYNGLNLFVDQNDPIHTFVKQPIITFSINHNDNIVLSISHIDKEIVKGMNNAFETYYQKLISQEFSQLNIN